MTISADADDSYDRDATEHPPNRTRFLALLSGGSGDH